MNLLNAFKDMAGDQLADLASGYLGTSKTETASAMGQALPAILGGLVGKVNDESSARNVLDFLNTNNLDGSMLNNLGGLFGSPEKTSGLMGMGGTILNFLMGNRSNAVIDLLTRVTGLDKTKMGGLIKIAAPLLMSFIGKKVKSENLGVGGLLKMITSQKEHVAKEAPAGLLGAMGMSGWGDSVGRVANAVGDGAREGAARTTAAAGQVVESGRSGFGKIWPWLLLLLGVAGLFYLLRGCSGDDITDAASDAMDKTEEMANKTGKAITDAAEATGDAVASAFESVKLPNGEEIKYEANSMIAKMSDYMSNDDSDDEKRFTFDNVNFRTGSAELTAESTTQLDNLVAVMKAYKTMNVRIEGHTDNTGDASNNMQLSKQRSLSVKNYLMKNGIAGARVMSEGYGQTKPIAKNDTEEGRLENRRVDVYVTKK